MTCHYLKSQIYWFTRNKTLPTLVCSIPELVSGYLINKQINDNASNQLLVFFRCNDVMCTRHALYMFGHAPFFFRFKATADTIVSQRRLVHPTGWWHITHNLISLASTLLPAVSLQMFSSLYPSLKHWNRQEIKRQVSVFSCQTTSWAILLFYFNVSLTQSVCAFLSAWRMTYGAIKNDRNIALGACDDGTQKCQTQLSMCSSVS